MSVLILLFFITIQITVFTTQERQIQIDGGTGETKLYLLRTMPHTSGCIHLVFRHPFEAVGRIEFTLFSSSFVYFKNT